MMIVLLVVLDSAVDRPSLLSPGANWVSYLSTDTSAELLVPVTSLEPGFVLGVLEELESRTIADARFAPGSTAVSTQVQFRLPGSAPRSPVTETLSVSIDSTGRVVDIAFVEHIPLDGKPHVKHGDLALVWTASAPPIQVPPPAEVQRLTPGKSLYPPPRLLPPTPTPTPTSLSGVGPATEADAIGANQGLFDDDRAGLLLSLRAQPDPRVSGFSFDSRTNTIDVAYVYAHPAQESRRAYDAFAWHVGTVLSDTFWFPALVQSLPSHGIDPAWLPKLRIQLDAVVYLCPASAQIALDAHRITQPDWLQKCAA